MIERFSGTMGVRTNPQVATGTILSTRIIDYYQDGVDFETLKKRVDLEAILRCWI